MVNPEGPTSPRKPPAALFEFYDDRAKLIAELGRAMYAAWNQDHALLCAVSHSTSVKLEKQLAKRGIVVSDAQARGQYVSLDREDILSEIIDRGRPDPARFYDVIGSLVERLVGEYPGVWMYSELETLLWNHGLERGAIEIHRLWASLAETQPIVVCFAFPVEALWWPIVLKSVLPVEVAKQVRALAMKGSSIALAIFRGPTGT